VKALTWHGKGDVRCETVPDPAIENPRDAVITVTASAIRRGAHTRRAHRWLSCRRDILTAAGLIMRLFHEMPPDGAVLVSLAR
jgi:threonine dehydrogenase-like Zn-dependent dehydrogenase